MYCMCVFRGGGGRGEITAVRFYDDITTVSDICVMAASRLRVESEVPGDIVSDVLWRNSQHTERGERESL